MKRRANGDVYFDDGSAPEKTTATSEVADDFQPENVDAIVSLIAQLPNSGIVLPPRNPSGSRTDAGRKRDRYFSLLYLIPLALFAFAAIVAAAIQAF